MREKGVTIITLVVTIVVLIILAGISIATLTNDKSVVENATQAQIVTELSQIQEKFNTYKVQLETLKMKQGDYSQEIDSEELEKEGIINPLKVNGFTTIALLNIEKLGIQSRLGNNIKNINFEKLYEKLTQLEDVFLIDTNTNKVYYVGKEVYGVEGKVDENTLQVIEEENSQNPQIVVEPIDCEDVAEVNITINTIPGEYKIENENEYEYYISTSKTSLLGGEWKTYTNGQTITLKRNKTRDYYMFVKRIQDEKGNKSKQMGKITLIGGEEYHRFGPYRFKKRDGRQYSIYLDNQDATTQGSTVIYEKYGEGIYLDEDATRKMTAMENPITIPQKEYVISYHCNEGELANVTEVGTYHFDGYYTASNGMGTQMIDETGKITEDFQNTAYLADDTLYAKWTGGTVALPTPKREGYSFEGWYSESSYIHKVGDGGEIYQPTNETTLYPKWTINNYNVTFAHGNYVFGLDNVGSTSSGRSIYSVTNKIVTVTATADDGYGFVNAKVYLEAEKTYTFKCTTSGTWGGNGADTVEAFLMLNGQYGTYYHMKGNNGYDFVPEVSGVYYLRLDVNQNGKTHTFSNIEITEKAIVQTKVYGSELGTLATPNRPFYTFAGWYTAETGGTQISSSTTVPAMDSTYYAHWTEQVNTSRIENITADGYDVYIHTNASIANVRVPTWTEYNGQDDLLNPWTNYYLATKQYTGYFYFRVNIVEHNSESGQYHSHIYGYNASNAVAFTAGHNNIIVPASPITINAYAGKLLYTDPTFAKGNNAVLVYNNKGNGTVTHTRKAMSDNPAGSGYGIEIRTTGEASPGHGGFYFATATSANKEYITRIVAKIPIGYNINWASNAYGSTGAQQD